MNRLGCFLACSLLVSCTTPADRVTFASQVIGMEAKDLSAGWNEIKVNLLPIPNSDTALFATLDRLGEFIPPTGVLGDELVFDLDGYHQKYRFASYDLTNRVYTLKLVPSKMFLPQEISLDWIPLPRVFWVNHRSTNAVSYLASGELAASVRRHVDREEVTESHDVEMNRVTILPVSPDSPKLIYTFKGGKIGTN